MYSNRRQEEEERPHGNRLHDVVPALSVGGVFGRHADGDLVGGSRGAIYKVARDRGPIGVARRGDVRVAMGGGTIVMVQSTRAVVMGIARDTLYEKDEHVAGDSDRQRNLVLQAQLRLSFQSMGEHVEETWGGEGSTWVRRSIHITTQCCGQVLQVACRRDKVAKVNCTEQKCSKRP